MVVIEAAVKVLFLDSLVYLFKGHAAEDTDRLKISFGTFLAQEFLSFELSLVNFSGRIFSFPNKNC